MAILSIDRVQSGRGGDWDEKWNRHYTQTYQVLVDDPNDGAQVVVAAVALAVPLYSSYINGNDFDLHAVCVGLKPTAGEHWKQWFVTAEFKNNTDQEEHTENPLNMPVRKRIEHEPLTKKKHRDAAGKLILNSAGDLYEDQDVESTRAIHIFTRNEATINNARVDLYNDAVNADVFDGIAKEHGKMRITYGERQVQSGVVFYPATYSVSVSPDEGGWNADLYDRGAREKDTDGTLIVIQDKFLKTPAGNVFLNGNGKQLAVGADPVKLPNQPLYTKLAFSGLNLTS